MRMYARKDGCWSLSDTQATNSSFRLFRQHGRDIAIGLGRIDSRLCGQSRCMRTVCPLFAVSINPSSYLPPCYSGTLRTHASTRSRAQSTLPCVPRIRPSSEKPSARPMVQIGYDLLYTLHPSGTAEAVHTWLLIDVKMSLRASWSEEVMLKFNGQRVDTYVAIV